MEEDKKVIVGVDKDEVRDEIIRVSSSVGKSHSFTAFLFIMQAAADRYKEVFGESIIWGENKK